MSKCKHKTSFQYNRVEENELERNSIEHNMIAENTLASNSLDSQLNRDRAEALCDVLGLNSAYLRFTELNFALLSMASLSLPWLRLT